MSGTVLGAGTMKRYKGDDDIHNDFRPLNPCQTP